MHNLSLHDALPISASGDYYKHPYIFGNGILQSQQNGNACFVVASFHYGLGLFLPIHADSDWELANDGWQSFEERESQLATRADGHLKASCQILFVITSSVQPTSSAERHPLEVQRDAAATRQVIRLVESSQASTVDDLPGRRSKPSMKIFAELQAGIVIIPASPTPAPVPSDDTDPPPVEKDAPVKRKGSSLPYAHRNFANFESVQQLLNHANETASKFSFLATKACLDPTGTKIRVTFACQVCQAELVCESYVLECMSKEQGRHDVTLTCVSANLKSHTDSEKHKKALAKVSEPVKRFFVSSADHIARMAKAVSHMSSRCVMFIYLMPFVYIQTS
jgi:hypothetical protein